MSLVDIHAHTPSKDMPGRWHMLEEHLIETARATHKFAKPFGCENCGFALGIFHDLGKVNPAFQNYLKACDKGEKPKSVPHSICGASYLWKILLRTNVSNAANRLFVSKYQLELPQKEDLRHFLEEKRKEMECVE